MSLQPGITARNRSFSNMIQRPVSQDANHS